MGAKHWFKKKVAHPVSSFGKKVEKSIKKDVKEVSNAAKPIVKEALNSVKEIVGVPGAMVKAQKQVVSSIGGFAGYAPWIAAAFIAYILLNSTEISQSVARVSRAVR